MFWFPAITNGVTQMDGFWYISWPCFPGVKQNTAGLVGGETQNSPLLFVPFVSCKRSFIPCSNNWWVALINIILSTLAWYKNSCVQSTLYSAGRKKLQWPGSKHQFEFKMSTSNHWENFNKKSIANYIWIYKFKITTSKIYKTQKIPKIFTK